MTSNLLLSCCTLLLLPSIFPSIRVFSSESILHIRSKYWGFSFSISPSNEYLGLISFTMDWLDILVIQGTLKSLLQHHSSRASILWRSAFLYTLLVLFLQRTLTQHTLVDNFHLLLVSSSFFSLLWICNSLMPLYYCFNGVLHGKL